MLNDRQKEILETIKNNPVKIAHAVGFNDMKELHNQWLKAMIFEREDTTLIAHRSSYKTTCLSVAIAVLMILKPNENILFFRKSDDGVKEIVRQISKILDHDLLKAIAFELYGVELVQTELSAFTITTNLQSTTKGYSQLTGLGIKSNITGKKASKIFTDDITSIKDRISKAERDFTKLQYQELQNIVVKGGRIFNTCTVWHKEDCVTIMPNIHKYPVEKTGLVSMEKQQELRKSMTPALYGCNYQLVFLTDEDALFKSPNFFNDTQLLRNGVGQIDASYGGADGTAFTILKTINGKHYVYGKRWNKHIEKCLPEIYQLWKYHQCGTVYVERNADKGWTAKELRAKGIPVAEYHESMNKYIKVTTNLLKHWDNIYFHESTDTEYLNEILDFTEDAEHDDSCDSLASLLREKLDKGQWLV